jgi:1,4-dihydroxy-2-naphthoate octaprenyltransferase
MEKNNSPWLIFLRVAQPLQLIMSLFTYTLGIGLVHYLGRPFNWGVSILGLLLILAIFLSRNFLQAYFIFPEPLPSSGIIRTDNEGKLEFIKIKAALRQSLLQIALVALSMGAVVTALLIFLKAVNLSVVFVLGISLILIFIEVLPPLRLNKLGYGEICEAFLLANMSPALAFLLLRSESHVLLLMLTLPLTLLYLAMRIASSFEYYAYDSTHATGSMLSFMGWQRGMVIHNLSILMAFLIVAVFLLFGLSWTMAWPIFLALPLGGLQIFQMIKIADGAKPNWGLLRLNSLGTFIIVVYLITFTLWSH